MKLVLLFSIFCLYLLASDLHTLLQQYESSKELSHITKKESAGFAEVFTRKDLEKMQAYTLRDVLKLLPSLTYTRTPNNISLFTVASFSYINATAVRIYINDHDITSASFGSGFIIWGDMPIEYIDHIEVYRGSSSIEFGNEPAIIVIKIYTKLPFREVGSKLRLVGDSKRSFGGDFYTAQSQENANIIFYAHQLRNAQKHRNYEEYKISPGYRDKIFYSQYQKDAHNFEISHYTISKDSFLGLGKEHHPTGGGLDAYHFYAIYSYKPDKTSKIKVALDEISYDQLYKDPDGIYTEAGMVKDYSLRYKDKILTLSYNQNIDFGNLKWYGGAFVKRKEFSQRGRFDTLHSQANNAFNLYSIFSDIHYRPNGDNWFILSLKADHYAYEKNIKNHNELIFRASYIKQLGDKQLKFFYTKTYFPVPFYKLCSSAQLPIRGNPNLKFPNITLYTFELAKKSDPISFIRLIHRHQKHRVYYKPQKGYVNSNITTKITHLELGQTFRYDQGKAEYNCYYAWNNLGLDQSPRYGASLRWFHSTKKIDLYGELLFKSSYDYFGKKIDPSLGATLALKYHYSKDLSLGLKGVNLFNGDFRQAYIGVDEPIEVESPKFILNLEYLF